ncbi:MAG TPA: tRNA (cytidine(34)-2'-O)-methyltransferase [Acidimicrobiia bacterium]|nr:tRNA (cytidine(34)-2'-O)-methyltransferase [Acidimicrobiia bacterium]
MFEIVLYRPEIPPNTGNCMRLAAITGCRLHLIEPLGFTLDNAKLRRAGMDYRDRAVVEVHPDLDAWQRSARPGRVFALAKVGTTRYTDVEFNAGDSFLFGPESVGLPTEVVGADFITQILTIPMQPDVRSLNLANAVAIVIYEAWRQHRFTLPEV